MPGSSPPRVIAQIKEPATCAKFLRAVAGTYQLPSKDRVRGAVFIVLLLGIAFPFGIALSVAEQLPSIRAQILAYSCALMVLLLSIAAAMDVATTTVEIGVNKVTKRSWVKVLDWEIDVGSVHQITLSERSRQLFVSFGGSQRYRRIDLPAAYRAAFLEAGVKAAG